MSTAFLFPGQGAQNPGFLHQLRGHSAVESTLNEAATVLGCDPLSLDSADALRKTVPLQLAVLVAGVATTRALADCEITPSVVAGHSIGTFTAAVATGALSFPDALRLVRVRAECMQSAYPHGYGMMAVVGLGERRVRAIIQDIRKATTGPSAGIYIAAINAPDQIAISGTHAALDSAATAARRAGARKVVTLAVAVPSHCELLDGVSEQLRSELRSINLVQPRVTYLCNHSARAVRSADDIREDLIRGVATPVRWHESTEVMAELGARLFIELPPGAFLSRLARAAFPDRRALAICESEIAGIAQIAKRDCAARLYVN
jgi:malonate decarboxylase epsilon subunit